MVYGTTRMGKARLAELLITQDIRRGDTTIVFDRRGALTCSSACGRRHTAPVTATS
ncbi:hypothetical protein Pvag_pPag20082 (plasmid) [Pantoea vagans C9-1]|nr:hypothetical protein Pvag_pPag20082 [Pantoea vagans C9-1]